MRFPRRVSFLSLLLLAFVVCPATPQQPRLAPDKQTMPLIGVVTNQALAQESGCRFAKRGETPDVKYIFISDLAGTVLMNLAGRDERLRLVKSVTARRRFRHRDARGDQFIELYRGGDATVQLIKTITFPCKPPYELCDLVEMKAVITVTKGQQRETIRAEGGCGNGES